MGEGKIDKTLTYNTNMINELNEDLKFAMKSKQPRMVTVLRSVKSAISNAEIAKRDKLTDLEILQVIRKQVSQREDSIKQFTEGGRQDLALNEELELIILQKYLPTEMSDEGLESIVDLILSDYTTPTKKDMGEIIKGVIDAVNGQADNKRISAMVGKKLA
jgi:uncharacterized protein YqeY